MKNKQAKFLILSFLLGLILSYNACTRDRQIERSDNSGTVVGNPLAPVTNKIVSSVCTVVTGCNPQVTFAQCAEGVSTATGVNLPLGLPATYSTLQSITQAEASGELAGNSAVGSQCTAAIQNLTCADPTVQSAYNKESAANPFAGAVYMISGQTCGNALAPLTQYTCSTKVFLRGVANSANGPAIPPQNLNFSVSPSLPPGLELDAQTGIISGTPTTVVPMAAYVITATSATGATSTTTVNLRTADGYLVNDLTDKSNSGPGCLSASGTCTLRAALEEINTQPSPNVIVLPAGQINLTLGTELSINNSTEIFGDCASPTTIDGQGTQRVFHITAGPTNLQNLVIQNGRHSDGGSGLLIETVNAGYTADLKDVTIQNNISDGAPGDGAGVSMNGTINATLKVQMTRTLVKNNTSLLAFGGGLSVGHYSELTMDNSTVENNSAVTGGGYVINGLALITETSLLGNTATDKGGALYCASSVSGIRKATLENITVANNSAAIGSAITYANSGVVEITNATIVGNHATSGTGQGGALSSNGGGGSLTIKNSIVANNDNNGVLLNCGVASGVISQGYNLSDNSDCPFNSTSDKLNVNPQLGALQNNGGFAKTLALLTGSPAINAIPTPALCPAYDQRGAARSANGTCDIGAFEGQ